MTVPPADAPRQSRARWPSWLLGSALLAVVVGAALHFTEERAFVQLVERAEPWWVLAAAALQAATYAAQGLIWRSVGTAAGQSVPLGRAIELSLVKVFADQALPSAGVSSSIMVARALERHHVPAPAVKAAVLVNLATYHLAYSAALCAALALMAAGGRNNPVVLTSAGAFILFSLALSGAVLALPGRRPRWLVAAVRRIPALGRALDYVAGADARLARSPRVVAEAVGLQTAIVLLDATTMWTLILALGVAASPSGVFVSFMIASLFRTIGIVPGGLGTFEATSVLMLRTVGVDLAVALAATLLFRGLSFWLPMLPGYWYSSRALRPSST